MSIPRLMMDVARYRLNQQVLQVFFNEVGKALHGLPHYAVAQRQGAASIEPVTAIYHAARTGTRVALPLGPDNPLYEGWIP